MKRLIKFLIYFLPLIYSFNVFAQSANPRPARSTWYKELDYFKNGAFTMQYKTIASPTFTGTATGPFDGAAAFTAAGGDRALQWYATHSDTLTGTLVTYYGRSTGGDSSGAGTIRGFEIGGRLIDAAGMKASVVTGGYSWADAKQGTVTTLRGFEASLDGAAGSTVTTASGIVIFNNSSGTQTNSYAIDINEGNPSGRKAFTADFRMQNGALFDNAVDGVLEINEASDEFKLTFGSNTITASSSDVTLFDFGTIDLATDALDLSEGDITNGGVASFDQVQADASALVIGAGTETVAVNSSDWDVSTGGAMSGIESITLDSGAKIFSGTAANGDSVYAEVGTVDAIGSIYLNTTNGYLYIQVANDGAASDWFKVNATDAD